MSAEAEDESIKFVIGVDDDGGRPIVDYNVTCEGAGKSFTVSGATSELTLTGLQNDVPYTCTASVSSSIGLSSPTSSAANNLVPEAPSTGLPIWLLYEATQ